MIRSDVFEVVGMYDETDRLTPDWDFFLRVASAYDIAAVPEPLVMYRIHPGQTSSAAQRMDRAARRVASRALRRMGPLLGSWAALLRVRKEIRNFPGHVRTSAGGRTLGHQFKDFFESLVILVNPHTTRLP